MLVVRYDLASRSDPVARDLTPAPGDTVRVPVIDQEGREIAVAEVVGDAERIEVRGIDPPLPEEAEDGGTRFSGGWVRDEAGAWRLVNLAVVRPDGPTRRPWP